MGGDHRKRVLDAMGRYFDRIEDSPSFRDKEVEKRKSLTKKKVRKKPRGCRSEAEEHIDIADYLRLCKANFTHLNMNSRSAIAAKRARRMGSRKGSADLLILKTPPKMAGKKGVAMEVKALDGRPSVEQIDWLHDASKDGYVACVVWGAYAAINLLRELGYYPQNERADNGTEFKKIGSKKSGVLQIQAVPARDWEDPKAGSSGDGDDA